MNAVAMSDHIQRTPGVACGKPVIRGTRITVEFVLERLADGASVDDLVADYEGRLTAEQVQAAVLFARDHLRGETLVELTPKPGAA